MRKKITRILLTSSLLVLIFLGVYNWPLLHAQFITKTVVGFGQDLRHKRVDTLKSYFTSDGKLIYKNQELTCEQAFNNFKKRIEQNDFNGWIYIDNHDKVSSRQSEVSVIGSFQIQRVSFQVGGMAKMRNTGLFSWKIARLSSNHPAFGWAFFNAPTPEFRKNWLKDRNIR